MGDKTSAEAMLDSMAMKAGVLKKVFTAVIVSCLVFFSVALLIVIAGQLNSVGGSEFASLSIASLVTWVLTGLIGLLVLMVLRNMFSSMSKRESPFTSDQSKQFVIIGILLLIDVAIEAFASVQGLSFFQGLVNADSTIAAETGSFNLFFNASYFIAAIVCFCLSYLFKYGSLLQWLYDETV